MKSFALILVPVMLSFAARATVDVYSANELQQIAHKLAQKHARSATEDLARYGNHYFLFAFRDATGSSELHEHEADIFVIQNGDAMLVTGGKIVNPRTTKPGEIRGSSIEGGQRRHIGAGDVVHIPAGTPHQLLIESSKPFTYFVVKVTGQ